MESIDYWYHSPNSSFIYTEHIEFAEFLSLVYPCEAIYKDRSGKDCGWQFIVPDNKLEELKGKQLRLASGMMKLPRLSEIRLHTLSVAQKLPNLGGAIEREGVALSSSGSIPYRDTNETQKPQGKASLNELFSVLNKKG